jgi:hypothetical protein
MMALRMHEGSISEPPEVDKRLAVPETRCEVEDGRVVYVPPADEPHAKSHVSVGALVKAHRADGYSVAADMLTRTSLVDDLAPDVSVYPTARDPRTGGRRLEEIAFEIVSAQALSHVAGRAAKLAARGVRRVFALDVERMRALEWGAESRQWAILAPSARIEDPALAVPLPIAALLDAARSDDAIVGAFRAKRHPEFLAERLEGREEGRAEGREEGRAEGREEGRAEGREEGREEGRTEGLVTGRSQALIILLAARRLELTDDERRRILCERDPGRLERWLTAAHTSPDVAAVLALP